jgi:hypothetical protein
MRRPTLEAAAVVVMAAAPLVPTVHLLLAVLVAMRKTAILAAPVARQALTVYPAPLARAGVVRAPRLGQAATVAMTISTAAAAAAARHRATARPVMAACQAAAVVAQGLHSGSAALPSLWSLTQALILTASSFLIRLHRSRFRPPGALPVMLKPGGLVALAVTAARRRELAVAAVLVATLKSMHFLSRRVERSPA